MAINEYDIQRVALATGPDGGAATPVSASNPLPLGFGAAPSGLSQFGRIASADVNAAVVKAGPGMVFGYSISNTNAAARYVKFYNKATAPTVGTDVPIRRVCIPAGQTVQFHTPVGLAGFTAGIAIGATTGALDNDTGALSLADLVIAIDYV